MLVYMIQNLMEPAFNFDIFKHPLHQRCKSSSEIVNAYDTIVYSKGGIVVSMIRNVLGELRFKSLLREYIKRYKWGVATTENLLALLEEFGSSIDFRGWVMQDCYPLVEVEVHCISQKKFSEDTEELWEIPIEYVCQHGVVRVNLTQRSMGLEDPGEMIKLNHKGWGYYRTVYSKEALELVCRSLYSLGLEDRLHLMTEAMALNARSVVSDWYIAKLLLSYPVETDSECFGTLESCFSKVFKRHKVYSPSFSRKFLEVFSFYIKELNPQSLGSKDIPVVTNLMTYGLNLELAELVQKSPVPRKLHRIAVALSRDLEAVKDLVSQDSGFLSLVFKHNPSVSVLRHALNFAFETQFGDALEEPIYKEFLAEAIALEALETLKTLNSEYLEFLKAMLEKLLKGPYYYNARLMSLFQEVSESTGLFEELVPKVRELNSLFSAELNELLGVN